MNKVQALHQVMAIERNLDFNTEIDERPGGKRIH